MDEYVVYVCMGNWSRKNGHTFIEVPVGDVMEIHDNSV